VEGRVLTYGRYAPLALGARDPRHKGATDEKDVDMATRTTATRKASTPKTTARKATKKAAPAKAKRAPKATTTPDGRTARTSEPASRHR
jgi:hypothetical protein